MENELEYLDSRFAYYIIMPDSQDEINISTFLKDSYFNRFDKRLLESESILELISYLPFDIRELKQSWIMSANQYRKDYYYIRFIQEQNVTEEILAHIKNSYYGCVFLLKGLLRNSDEMSDLINFSKMPIVSLEKPKDKRVLELTRTNINEIALQLINIYVSESNCYLAKHNTTSTFNKFGNISNLKSVNEASLKYITPLTATLDRLRGLYSFKGKNLYLRKKNKTTTHNIKSRELEADKLNVKYLKQIIVEKFIVLMLGFLEEGSFDQYDEAYLQMINISKTEITNLLTDFSPSMLSELTKKVSKNFDKLSFKTDIVICIPTINRQLLDQISESYGLLSKDFVEKYGRVDKESYYEILDSIMNADTYYFGVDMFEGLISKIVVYLKLVTAEDFKDERKVLEINQAFQKMELIEDHFYPLIGERALEIDFLSQLYVMYTLSQRNPFLRLRPIPFKDIYAKMKSYYSVSFFDNVSDLNDLFNTFSRQFNESITDDLKNLLLKHTSTITFITDMPIEWIKLNGYPLNILKKISRIPISPGNGIVEHYNSISQKKYVLKSDSTKILLIDAIAENDTIKQHAISLKLQLEELFALTEIEFIFKEINRKQDYFDVINTIQPDVLIHFGHGDYDDDNHGSLTIGEEKIYSYELDGSLNWQIPFVILGACESDFVKSTHLNMANMFLGTGAISVIGTYFYVDATYTMLFILNLMKHLIFAFKTRIDFQDVGDLILMNHRTLYIIDLVHSLEDQIENRQIELDEISKNVLNRVFLDYFKYCTERSFSLKDYYQKDKEIFKEVFRQSPVLLYEYEELLKNNEVLYHSLFFSTLGSPDVIRIEKNENLVEMNELQDKLFSQLVNRRRSH